MTQVAIIIMMVSLMLFSDQRYDPATLIDVWWGVIFALLAGLADDVIFEVNRK